MNKETGKTILSKKNPPGVKAKKGTQNPVRTKAEGAARGNARLSGWRRRSSGRGWAD
jgi:hypothetical protein